MPTSQTRTASVARVVAINPYDYGWGGGIRRSSTLAKILFTAMLWPVIGEFVLATGTKGILRKIMEGGMDDPRNISADLIDELLASGSLPAIQLFQFRTRERNARV